MQAVRECGERRPDGTAARRAGEMAEMIVEDTRLER
jgi:hypothetical protein